MFSGPTEDEASWDIVCVLGEDGADPFLISVTKETTIAQFKKAIHQRRSSKLSHLQPEDLKLYLIDRTSDDDDEITGTVNTLY